MKVPEFYKHPKKAGGYIGRNVQEKTIKMKTIVRKPLMITNPIYLIYMYKEDLTLNNQIKTQSNPTN